MRCFPLLVAAVLFAFVHAAVATTLDLSVDEGTSNLTADYQATLPPPATVRFRVFQERDGTETLLETREANPSPDGHIEARFHLPVVRNCLVRVEVEAGNQRFVEAKNLYRAGERSAGKARQVSSVLHVPLSLLGGLLERYSSALMGPRGDSLYQVNLDPQPPAPLRLATFPGTTLCCLSARPDGKSLAFVRSRLLNDHQKAEVIVFDLATHSAKTVAEGASPVWRSDGRALYFLVGGQLREAAIATGSKASPHRGTLPPLDGLLGWTRDGSFRLLATKRLGTATQEVVSIRTDKGNAESLSFDWGYLWLPQLAPDGTRIVRSEYQGAGKHNALVLDTLGGQTRLLTDGSSEDDAPTWSSDGRSVFFVSDRH